jgi:hypothetical protein
VGRWAGLEKVLWNLFTGGEFRRVFFHFLQRILLLGGNIGKIGSRVGYFRFNFLKLPFWSRVGGVPITGVRKI